MPLLALIAGIVALVVFIIEGVRTKALIPWGFVALTAMFILLYLADPASDRIHF